MSWVTVCHVLGARPNFMKAAPVIASLDATGVEQTVVHTGQHYDHALSEIFLGELSLPEPAMRLGVGSGTQAEQTAALLVALEKAFAELAPQLVVAYGDVNSTLAAALVAAKAQLPLAHVEAGLRSFDLSMPEEVNRRVVDALSELLFVTSPEAIGHLGREGVDGAKVHFVGNTMIDTLLANLDRLDADAARARHGIEGPFGLVTLHRPGNVDDPARAAVLVEMLRDLAEVAPIVFPVHPRTRPRLAAAGLEPTERLRVLDPLGYIEFMSLLRGSAVVVTDSGGVQEETTALGVPCLTLRPNTERPITISHGTNRLVTVDNVVEAASEAVDAWPATGGGETPPLWDGRSGPRIAKIIGAWLDSRAATEETAGR